MSGPTPETQTSAGSAARIAVDDAPAPGSLPDCPTWCERHTGTASGWAHHARRLSADGDRGQVWVFKLATGGLRVAWGPMSVEAGPFGDSVRLAMLAEALGFPSAADAIRAADELAMTP